MKKTLFLLFGVTGDLAQRKILPALFMMRESGKYNFETLGVGRREFDDNDMHNYLIDKSQYIGDKASYEKFIKTMKYFKVELSEFEHYQNLLEYIKSQKNFDEVVLYLSISPDFFEDVLKNLKKSNLNGYIDKIVFEKPFGYDLKSAKILNDMVLDVFEEDKVYRIDHYLGKEPVQNILNFRFSNVFFEHIWNNQYIDHIQIIASEKVSVLDRGPYYDGYGALKDMLQNHLIQMLAQVVIPKSQDLNFENIRNEKSKAIKKLRLFDGDVSNLVFGQYDGYLSEKGVKENSNTDTFVAAKLEIDTPEMKGVPIYVKTGKALDDKITKVIVQFKSLKYFDGTCTTPNKIVFDMCNNESITVDFNAKNLLENKTLKTCNSVFNQQSFKTDAYYRLLGDVMLGESLWFPRWDMIASSWEFIDYLADIKDKGATIHGYEIGTKGPIASDELLKKDGRERFE